MSKVVEPKIFDPSGPDDRRNGFLCPSQVSPPFAIREDEGGTIESAGQTRQVIGTCRASPFFERGIVKTPALKSTSRHRSPRNSAFRSPV